MQKHRTMNYIWVTEDNKDVNLYDMTDLQIKDLIEYMSKRAPWLSKEYDTILNIKHPSNFGTFTSVSDWIKILLIELKFRDVEPPDLEMYKLRYFMWRAKEIENDNFQNFDRMSRFGLEYKNNNQ